MPRALEAASAWRSKEQLTWVREKFDGTPRPELSPGMAPQRTERLDARWEGKFRGQWLLAPSLKAGIQPFEAELVSKFTSSEQTRVSVSLNWISKAPLAGLSSFDATGKARELRAAPGGAATGLGRGMLLELRSVGSEFWIFVTPMDGGSVGIFRPEKSSLMRSAKSQ